MARTFDSRAWLAWLFVGGALVLTVRNPLYLVLLLTVARAVHLTCAATEATGWRLPFWRIALTILIFSTLFNMLTAHFGQSTIFRLPEDWWLIGGPLTLEAAIYGFINGLSLVALLAFFVAFNAIVPVHEVTGLSPSALHELGIVMLVAITYVPETARQYQRIREAQAIRGHRLQGLRDWRPIIIPMLIGGLERAMNLAETMVARGFGSTTERYLPNRLRLLLVAGLALVLGGAVCLALQLTIGWLILVSGAAGIATVYLHLQRQTTRTRYRPHVWTPADTVFVIASILPVSLFVAVRMSGGAGLVAYSPYPLVALPAFDVWVGGVLLLLVTPALLQLRT